MGPNPCQQVHRPINSPIRGFPVHPAEACRWSPSLLPLASELRTRLLIAAYSMRHRKRACRAFVGTALKTRQRKTLDETGMEVVPVWLHLTGDDMFRIRDQQTYMFCGRIPSGASC
jgi:hypothetical protein